MKFTKLLTTLSVAMPLMLSGISYAECVINPGFEGLNTAVKGFAVPASAPVRGVEYIGVEQATTWLNNPDYVFIDVRPPRFFKSCQLKGSQNFEYTFAGPEGERMYKSGLRLTKTVIEQLIGDGKTVVLFCNNAFSKKGCHRAVNAAITAVCTWEQPAESIKWFGEGVSGSAKKQAKLIEGPICRPPWQPKKSQ